MVNDTAAARPLITTGGNNDTDQASGHPVSRVNCQPRNPELLKRPRSRANAVAVTGGIRQLTNQRL